MLNNTPSHVSICDIFGFISLHLTLALQREYNLENIMQETNQIFISLEGVLGEDLRGSKGSVDALIQG